MTISSEITRLQWAKSDIKTAIENKWVTVPSNITIDEYAPYIDKIWWGDVYKWEYIEYNMIADGSWNLYVPIGWYSHTRSNDCSYSWKISVDGWAETTYTWTGSFRGAITLSWYIVWTSYTIKITPTNETYGWALAYGWDWVTWASNLTEVIYDSSYMWYGVSATDTGNYFRYNQYKTCSNLINPVDEFLGDTVTTIWDEFRYWQYGGCTSLIKAPDEYMPNTVTTIWEGFRSEQFYSCSNLREVWDEKLSDSLQTIWPYFRRAQFFNCTKLTSTALEALPDGITSIWYNFRAGQYRRCTSLSYIKWWKDLSIWNSNYRSSQFDECTSNKTVKVLSNVWYQSTSTDDINNNYVTQVFVPSAYLTTFKNSGNYPRVNITDSKFVWY